ncbi:hypothetical protein a10_00731 [Streptomyces acidiscabies]|nr:hypothetical protein a10_00731 [Streptomyces acidiscabies]GAV38769.1 hypothetical protein Saa2_01651 [Streptomyces acidiscabies]
MFSISYDQPPPPGNRARASPQYRAKSALRSPARPNTARSYADDTWPGVSYPSGDSTCVSSAPSARALACMRVAVVCQPPLSAARTCTASLPEFRNTPRHRSATVYVRPSATPTMLLPAPMPSSSRGVTRCRVPAGRTGRTVSANRVFRVLAGGSLRCASEAARTAPLSTSATTQERAETPGSAGAPGRGWTWGPGRCRRAGEGAPDVRGRSGDDVRCGSGVPGPADANASGPAARDTTAHSAQADTAAREENPIVIRST